MRIALLALSLVLVSLTGATAQHGGTRASPSDARYTDVRIEGNVVTIVVPLAVVYGWEADGPPSAEAVALIKSGFAAAELLEQCLHPARDVL